MEVSSSVSPQRRRPYEDSEHLPSLAHPYAVLPAKPCQQSAFGREFVLERDSFLGQPESCPDCRPQQQGPAKRRKLTRPANATPQLYVTSTLQTDHQKSHLHTRFEGGLTHQRSILSNWNESTMMPSQGLTQLPRRMAELVCGRCGLDRNSYNDCAPLLPQIKPPSSELYQPYTVEKPPMIEAEIGGWCADITPSVDAAPSLIENAIPRVSSHMFTLVQAIHPQTSPNSFPRECHISHKSHPTIPLQSDYPSSIEDKYLAISTALGDDRRLEGQAWTDCYTTTGAFPAPALTSDRGGTGVGMMTPTNMAVDTLDADGMGPPALRPSTSSMFCSPIEAESSLAIQNTKRGPFKDLRLREQTAQTRRIGSCIRCRMQRIRCQHNPDDEGGPCLTCKKVNTKVSRFPCLRYKITDVKLFKVGQVPGFEWTKRWNSNILDEIKKWASSEVKIICVSKGESRHCIALRVRKFVPLAGDKMERTWDYHGTKMSVKVPPYALVDLEHGKSEYMQLIDKAMGETLQKKLTEVPDRSLGLLRLAYKQAIVMCRDRTLPKDWQQLLLWTFQLWVAVRLSTTSDFIVGEEKLGMPDDILDATSPNPGKIPVPPVLGAQLDVVLIHHIQTNLRRELLERLQKMMLKSRPDTWLVTFLVTFILLHNTALIIAHDAAYARKHGMRRRFAREDKVKEYHLGANILLAYFHYCNKGYYPFSEDCRDQDLQAIADIRGDNWLFLLEARKFVRQHRSSWDRVREEGRWEHNYFFVSQMFEENWQPRV